MVHPRSVIPPNFQKLFYYLLSPNLYAFQFYHWKDMMKVLEGRPWCFDNMLIILKEADGDEQHYQVSLIHSPFWVRIKNLPFNYRSDDIVKALIGNMGEILDLEEDVLGFGRYRRIKVLLDVTKPLRRYRKLKDKKGREFQVDFAYERLPYFCFACGVMGHSERECHGFAEEDKQEGLGWSLALKATPRKGRTKEVQEERKYRMNKKVLFPIDNSDSGLNTTRQTVQNFCPHSGDINEPPSLTHNAENQVATFPNQLNVIFGFDPEALNGVVTPGLTTSTLPTTIPNTLIPTSIPNPTPPTSFAPL